MENRLLGKFEVPFMNMYNINMYTMSPNIGQNLQGNTNTKGFYLDLQQAPRTTPRPIATQRSKPNK